MEPSPTAEATRLIDPLRTSPAAKTPGTVVSSGSRPAADSPVAGASRPVRMKPERSSARTPCSHRVCGVGADEHEQGAGVQAAAGAPAAVGDRQSAQLTLAVQRGDLSVGQYLDVGVAGDLVGQVAGHGRREVAAAYQEVDPAGAAGQEDRGLAD